MRIAVSSACFQRLFASGEATQLEWVEACATRLALDGIVADELDFPRADADYVAQLRKIAIDLGLVPFGIDAPGLLDPAAPHERLQRSLTLARQFGALVIRTNAPPPGEIPPAAFVEAVRAARSAAKAAKAANVTILVTETPGTLAADFAGVRHLLKDVDSAWLRAAPTAVRLEAGKAKERFPAVVATPDDDADAVARTTGTRWLILDGAADPERPWDAFAQHIADLRRADARLRLEPAIGETIFSGTREDDNRSGHSVPG